MVTIWSVLENPQLVDATQKFTALFGGGFYGHVPDARLWYETEGDVDSRVAPYEETEEMTLQTLQDSIDSGRNLILERWPVLTYEPGCVY